MRRARRRAIRRAHACPCMGRARARPQSGRIIATCSSLILSVFSADPARSRRSIGYQTAHAVVGTPPQPAKHTQKQTRKREDEAQLQGWLSPPAGGIGDAAQNQRRVAARPVTMVVPFPRRTVDGLAESGRNISGRPSQAGDRRHVPAAAA